jgi:maltooligosyltrehalose trehalohydrolase
LIALRHEHPVLAHTPLGDAEVRYDAEARWLLLRNGPLYVAVNFAPSPASVPLPPGEPAILAAWSEGTHCTGTLLHIPPGSAAVLR